MSRRLVEISGSNWYDIGKALAEKVACKSKFAYEFDKLAYAVDSDIQELWRNHLAPHARYSMQQMTPNAYEFCSGFDSVFSELGSGYSVWELLTLYEVDMFLHEFHYKCHYCRKRIMNPPRYVCGKCNDAENASPKASSKGRAPAVSACSECYSEHPNCDGCSMPYERLEIINESAGAGIANKSGCTGFGYWNDSSAAFCGQTLEMATDTYHYGRFDTVYKLTNTSSNLCVMVYDVGCILSPFGLNSNKLGLCVFNLYNSDFALPPYAETNSRVPMAALQWEILMSECVTSDEAVSFLRGTPGLRNTFTSASFIICSSIDNKCSVIELSANNHWCPSIVNEEEIPPAFLESSYGGKWIVRANNCINGSTLRHSESLPLSISSPLRQKDLADSVCVSVDTPDLEWAKTALSTAVIQTEYCLSTVIMEPRDMSMHVRFRVGTRMSATLKDGGRWDKFHI